MAQRNVKKPKELTPVVYVAMVRRNEVDGNFYQVGDQTDLSGLTPEQIGFCLARAYYTPQNWKNVPKAVLDAYDASL